MDIASALLTKKAALIGGGTAATTTAVVVPIVVTKSKKESAERPASPSPQRSGQETESDSSGGDDGGSSDSGSGSEEVTKELKDNPLKGKVDLSFDNSDANLLATLNKPGHCIKGSFKGVENEKLKSGESGEHVKGLFKRPNNLTVNKTGNDLAPVNLSAVTGNDPKIKDFDFACFMFSRPTTPDTKDFRFELAIKKNNHGWLWMISKKDDKVVFREAIVHKPTNPASENWEGYSALDGEFTSTDEITPKFSEDIFADLVSYKATDCSEDNECKEAISGVFIKAQDNGKDFLPSQEDSNWTKAIFAFGSDNTYQGGNSTKRKGYFGGGGWYPHKQSQGNLVTFNKSEILDPTKGNWKDLIKFCQSSGNSGEPFTSLCPTTQE